MFYIKKLFPQSIKNLYHLVQAVLANVCYGFPARKLKVIGITGTDGKTTTTQMVTKILEETGKKVAMASTINFRLDGQEEKNLSHYTTASAFAVQKFLHRAVQANCEYLVLETSSHSLDQYRVWGIPHQTAVVTNITREHLDYHKTMEKYRAAKLKLFEKTKIAVVNLDMENPEEFMKYAQEKSFAYTISNTKYQISNEFPMPKFQMLKAIDIELGIRGTKYKIQNTEFELNLPGLFNVENALAATCVGLSEGISLQQCAEALAEIPSVPGRMESVPNSKGLDIIVDFALTPVALEKLYTFLVGVKKNRAAKIIAVFGSCGDRDRGKRPLMGEVVARYADIVVLTNDEPYHEEPAKIIAEIAAGIKNKKENETLWKIPDRRRGIHKALELAAAGDTLVVTGMGNFETMVVGDEKLPWNDREVIEEELQAKA